MSTKTRMRRVPEDYYLKVSKFGNRLGIPNTKAFLIREKILYGDFQAKRVKKKNGKEVFEIEV